MRPKLKTFTDLEVFCSLDDKILNLCMVEAQTSTMQLWSSFHCSHSDCLFLCRCAQWTSALWVWATSHGGSLSHPDLQQHWQQTSCQTALVPWRPGAVWWAMGEQWSGSGLTSTCLASSTLCRNVFKKAPKNRESLCLAMPKGLGLG